MSEWPGAAAAERRRRPAGAAAAATAMAEAAMGESSQCLTIWIMTSSSGGAHQRQGERTRC